VKLADIIKSKCEKCPYALGQVQFVQNPCPHCKANRYETYHRLIEARKNGPSSGGPVKG